MDQRKFALVGARLHQRNLGAAQAGFPEFFTGDWMAEVGLAGQQGWKVRTAQAAQALAEAELKATRARSLSSINLEVSTTRWDWISPGVPGTDRTVSLVARQALYTGGADSARIDQATQKVRQFEEELSAAELEFKRQLDLEVDFMPC